MSETRNCQSCKTEFRIEAEDLLFYAKLKVPPPTFCPDCRFARRFAFRNERSLYRRACNAPGHSEEIISIYAPASPDASRGGPEKSFTAYDQKYWWSDAWDPLTFGQSYDFSKPFFLQWKELRDRFPLQALSNSNTENSDYCNVNDNSKDCYLISASYANERTLYSNRIAHVKDSIDLYVGSKDELCYDCVQCTESYRLLFCRNTHNSTNSYFLYDCRGCSDCFGCTNLRNKQYCLWNEQLTKEEYQKRIQSYDLGSAAVIGELQKKFDNVCLRALHPYANIVKSVDAVGDSIQSSKNCYYCFDLLEAEDCKYFQWGGYGVKDTYDAGPGSGVQSELMYEVFDTGIQSADVAFTSVVYNSRSVRYAFNCYNCENIFGCIGLRKQKYCILNKQYTKEAYEALLPKVIEHMNAMPYVDVKGREYRYGEFFPIELSPFAYNETVAQEYYPLTEKSAVDHGYAWRKPEAKDVSKARRAAELPDNIKEIENTITNDLIACAHGGTCDDQCSFVFKIIPQELKFYRNLGIPVPRLCYNCRHYGRLRKRNPPHLYPRVCACAGKASDQISDFEFQNTAQHFHGAGHCPNKFETTYAPGRPEIIYCEACYQAEII